MCDEYLAGKAQPIPSTSLWHTWQAPWQAQARGAKGPVSARWGVGVARPHLSSPTPPCSVLDSFVSAPCSLDLLRAESCLSQRDGSAFWKEWEYPGWDFSFTATLLCSTNIAVKFEIVSSEDV